MIARHKIIDDFLPRESALGLAANFPGLETMSGWHVYDNPLELKFAMDDLDKMSPHTRSVFGYLQSDEFVERIAREMEIQGLENDPFLHGAGLHCMPPGGKLDMHLDYSIHPRTRKERRVNLILFLNTTWRQEWGGELVLYPADERDGTMTDRTPAVKILPKFNRAVVFETSDISWHGVPFISHEAAEPRKTLAIYYVSEPTGKQKFRPKALYARRPGVEDPYDKLRDIRAQRRLIPEDLTPEDLH
jgi:hypothetical protein